MGIDVVTPDITKPLREVDGVVVEVNAAPGFRMHTAPSEGKPRNVAAPLLDMLFPPGKPYRVPIIAITGTNGKTTTTRLIAHIYKQTKLITGYTTTDGIYIDDHLVEAGDNTGPQSAQVILRDPTVEVAVLETARGGILRAGLSFATCDVGVVLNVAADHLGLGDINTIEQMSHLKSVVAETVAIEGYAVLNADDPLVVAMAERVQGKVAYFSMKADSPIVKNHRENGGVAAVYSAGAIVICQGNQEIQVAMAEDVPVTMAGMAPFQIANALAATLAAYVQGVEVDTIRLGLTTFRASAEQTPGRMNLFEVKDYNVLIDYAHNSASYEALGGFIRNWHGAKIGVVGGPGDRRDEDLINLGKLSAQIFDRIIVKEDEDKRGRSEGEVAQLISQGIAQENQKIQYETILKEEEAINKALSQASPGCLIVFLPEAVARAIQLIKSLSVTPT
jgi:cyanophycin synthetase